jgi:hypothetical protein
MSGQQWTGQKARKKRLPRCETCRFWGLLPHSGPEAGRTIVERTYDKQVYRVCFCHESKSHLQVKQAGRSCRHWEEL